MSATALGARRRCEPEREDAAETRCLVQAVVIGYITAEAIPVGFIPPAGITRPIPPGLANHRCGSLSWPQEGGENLLAFDFRDHSA